MTLVKKTLLMTTSFVLLQIIALLVSPTQAFADTVGCGETYHSDYSSCDCDGTNGVPFPPLTAMHTYNSCCGWAYDNNGTRACWPHDPNSEEADERGRLPVDCGTKYHTTTNYCSCSNNVRLTHSGVADTGWYCCGWMTSDDKCMASENFSDQASAFELCRQIPDDDLRTKCENCANQVQGGYIWTAVGCIPTDYQGLVQTIMKIGLGAAGGFTFLVILAGSFQLTVSQGEPKKITEAKDMITSAIIGLIFIIFSVSLLQLIGVQILRIPGFG